MSHDTYYISTGEQDKMYTLRIRFTETVGYRTSTGSGSYMAERDHYVKNLSIDLDLAKEKAKEYVAFIDGAVLKDTKTIMTLEEIHRRSAEEMAEANEIARKAVEEQQFELDRQMAIRDEELLSKIAQGIFPFGKFKNVSFDSVFEDSRSYIFFWLSDKFADKDENSAVVNTLINALSSRYGDALTVPTANDNYFGDIKTRYKGKKATVVEDYGFDGYYGWTYIVKFVLETGELLTYMGGTAIESQVADKVVIDFTVKLHDEYEGEKSTKILRIKLHDVKELEPA